MPAHFELTLDTTAPAGVSVAVNGGDPATSNPDVTLTISTSDPATVGYAMKIYGDLSDSAAPSEYRAAEGDAPWITFAGTKAVRLSAGDGTKTVRVRVRDDVGNASAAATDTISLDTAVPVIAIVDGPTAVKISKVDGFDETVFSFQVDVAAQAWTVRVVPATGSPHNAGTQIPTTNGSSGISGGELAADTPQQVTITGADLEAASPGDGPKIVKAFARAAGGAQNWSL